MKVLLKATLALAVALTCATFTVNAQSKPKLNKPNPDANGVYTVVEQSASFPGGLKSFGSYLGKTIHYPEAARKNNVQGKVFVQFIVEKDGSLSSMKVVRGIGAGCDDEAVRALTAGPKWKPGKQGGKAVRQQYVVPINFTLAKA